MSNETTDKSRITTLKQELENVNSIRCLDTAIDKLTDVSVY